ncbi:MAG: hypothetical protein AAF528_02270 [Cyanobacteria bacterium P01_C01_bin.121]
MDVWGMEDCDVRKRAITILAADYTAVFAMGKYLSDCGSGCTPDTLDSYIAEKKQIENNDNKQADFVSFLLVCGLFFAFL